MVNYISEKQLNIEEFKTPFKTTLLPNNRWVTLSKQVPWDVFVAIYTFMMSNIGKFGISPRIPKRKIKLKIEFGSKLRVSLDKGFALIDTLSWDAYNESQDLIFQVENYKTLHGHYPILVQVDRIYATIKNRVWLKEREIRITAPALDVKSKKQKEESYYKSQKRRKETSEKNLIEVKFSQEKSEYNLNKIKAKT